MNDEIAQQVAGLLQKKIDFEQDLQTLLSENGVISLYRSFKYSVKSVILEVNQNSEFMKKIKFLTILEIQKEIDKLENQIKQLKYY